MTNYIEAVPAYGRDYTNQKAVLADWRAGKDFLALSATGQPMGYINKQDAKNFGIKVVIYYSKTSKSYSPE